MCRSLLFGVGCAYMPDSNEVFTRVELALATSKKLERDARSLKQSLAGIREVLQSESSQGEADASIQAEVSP